MTTLLRRLLVAMMLGVAVYGGFAIWRGAAAIGEKLASFSWWTFAAACALAFGNYLLRFWKWELYLALLGVRGVPKLDSMLTFFSGFVLTITPGKVGEVFKSVVLHEIHGVAVERTAPIVIAERLTDVIGIVVLILVGSSGFQGGLGWAVAGLAVVAIALACISSATVSEALLRLLDRAPGRIGALAPRVREAWSHLRVMTTPAALVGPTVLSIIAWALEGLALWIILRGFGEQTPAPLAAFFYATSTLAGALIPVPGGLGITEGALEEQLLQLGHVAKATSTSAMILVRFATLWFAVLVGFVALALLRSRYPALLRGDDEAARALAGKKG